MKCKICNGTGVAWLDNGPCPDCSEPGASDPEKLKKRVADLESQLAARDAEIERLKKNQATHKISATGFKDGRLELTWEDIETNERVELCLNNIKNEILNKLARVVLACVYIKARIDDPFGIYVGGVKVGEIPEPTKEGYCNKICPFLLDTYTRPGEWCRVKLCDICKCPGPQCPRHPDHAIKRDEHLICPQHGAFIGNSSLPFNGCNHPDHGKRSTVVIDKSAVKGKEVISGMRFSVSDHGKKENE